MGTRSDSDTRPNIVDPAGLVNPGDEGNRERCLLEPTGVGASNVDMGGAGVAPDNERASDKVGRVTTSGSGAQGNAPRKLQSKHRKLILDIKRCSASLATCNSYEKFQQESIKFNALHEAKTSFLCALRDLKDNELYEQFSESLFDQFKLCSDSYVVCERRFSHQPDNFDEDETTSDCEDDLEPSDSISQVTSRFTVNSKSSIIRRIEIERKKAQLANEEELAKARKMRLMAEAEARMAEAEARMAEAEARRVQVEAEAQRVHAEAENRRACLLAEADEAEALAKLRLETANLETEEKLIAYSERGSSVATLSKASKIKSRCRPPVERNAYNPPVKSNNAYYPCAKIGTSNACASKTQPENPFNGICARLQRPLPSHLIQQKEMPDTKPYCVNDNSASLGLDGHKRQNAIKCFDSEQVGPVDIKNLNRDACETPVAPALVASRPNTQFKTSMGPEPRLQTQDFNTSNAQINWHTYLDRQGRNEYITLAAQIAYDGNNIAFIFYENQIRRLMDESPFEERKLEVLRASCVGQPREMVNLFCAPMKSMSTSVRIEKALDRLRQRYGVSGGLTSEPKVRAIRHGAKVAFNSSSLKMYNEDLNTLEVFAYAHDEVEKLSGQLLLDTAARLPNTLKRRYLDFLDKKGLNLSRPGFESLRSFVVHEIDMMTSDYAQAFFKDEKDSSREQPFNSREFRVRQVAVGVENGVQDNGLGGPHLSTSRVRPGASHKDKPPPKCFVCSHPDCKHFLADCETFRTLSPKAKRQTVIDAKRCLNCLSLDHFVRDCARPSKCRECGPKNQNKHATALHECFADGNVGGADGHAAPIPAPRSRTGRNGNRDYTVRKMNCLDKRTVLLRTSAVRVVNPDTGLSTLAYAQHDTGSQVTLISDNLMKELGLNSTPDPTVTIRTLADQRVTTEGRTDFNLQSLSSGEEFAIKDAIVVPEFLDDKATLPHAVDTSSLGHFDGVEIPLAPDRDRIDVLIGQSDKALLAVLEEREGADPEEPNYVLTRLGPVASGGRAPSESNSVSAFRVSVEPLRSERCCNELQQEIASLKETIREYELQDEVIQPSRTDELARNLVEPHISVVNGRYEMPVPFKTEMLKKLPDNYDCAVKRTLSMRRKALQDLSLKDTLVKTFAQLVEENWIVPVDSVVSDSKWYLPFFVTRSAKPRVVYDGAAMVEGMSLNQAVLAGENLLNNLVEVLTRFRLGKYACVADVSKCFFQVGIPRDQQDLFRIVWFENNDLDRGVTQIFRFTRHVWGINSSPYVALLALKQLVAENPTNASQVTLSAVETNRYMDDLLLASNDLANLEAFASEGCKLFASRGFQLRKWVANSHAKSVLYNIPQCDLAASVSEIDLGSQPLPDSTALGLVWDTQQDKLRVHCREFIEASTRREMSSQLSSHFDPLGMASPFLLGGKLILQRVSSSGFGWGDVLPADVRSSWRKWLASLSLLKDFSIPRNCFAYRQDPLGMPSYQIHGFSDASDTAYCCVVYLRCWVAGKSKVSFLLGKSRVVLTHQSNWVISRKELEAAKLCSELVLRASEALQHLHCDTYLWTDSQVAFKWIANPDLHLARFVKRRVDKILRVAPSSAWQYVHTSLNPADVGTRDSTIKHPESVGLWLQGPAFLVSEKERVISPVVAPVVRATRLSTQSGSVEECDSLDKLIATSRDLYALKKRVAYLMAFVKYFVAVKFKKSSFEEDQAFLKIVQYVQLKNFGSVIEPLRRGSPDDFDAILRSMNDKRKNSDDLRRINELKTLRNLRPCVGADSLLRVEGRLENSELPIDSKHPIILPGRHPLTRLIVLSEHENSGHAGPAYTLMKIRQRFWVIHGVSSVKHFIAECGKCALVKAKPIRQLMADLPACRLTACNKPFKFCGIDYLGPFRYRNLRSECKAWGLLFSCMCTLCIHVELVTSLDLNNFLMAFTRFTNLRGSVDTVYSDNGSTFCAAADQLPKMLGSNEFQNGLRKQNINWVRIPPYAPSQGGSWESLVKLFKSALFRVVDDTAACRH